MSISHQGVIKTKWSQYFCNQGNDKGKLTITLKNNYDDHDYDSIQKELDCSAKLRKALLNAGLAPT